MKNVDVAWRLIDVVRVWRKLKKMTSTVNDLINAGGVYLISRVQEGRLKDKRRLKEREAFILITVTW